MKKPVVKNVFISSTSSICSDRQTKSSPGRGEFCTSKGLLLAFLSHIGTRKCSKFVVKCEKIVVLLGFRGHFGANSGSAMADE